MQEDPSSCRYSPHREIEGSIGSRDIPDASPLFRGEKVDEADIQIDDLNLDHYIDRIVMYIVCGGNLLMCGITIIGHIDVVMRQAGLHVEERIPLFGAPLPGASGGSTVAVSRSRHPSPTS